MIVYEASVSQFIDSNNNDDIEDVILARYEATTGRTVGLAERRSWQGSLGYMAKVLSDEEIPRDASVAVEYRIPQTQLRIDITLTGRGSDGSKNAVIIELKQWDQIEVTGKDAIVKTRLGRGIQEKLHPCYQAWSYAACLEGFNAAVHSNGVVVKPCAYLHNYVRDGLIDSPHYVDYLNKAPLFLKGPEERQLLRNFIKKYVKFGDSKEVLYELANGAIRPSKALSDGLKGMLTSKPEFVLIDDQKIVYEAAIAAARSASEERPRVVIIEGGPGTGKTILAINLLVKLTSLGLVGKYVSKNAAPRRVYESKLVGTIKRTAFSNLFTGSGGFIETAKNEFGFLIVDEAHRLNEKSGLYGNLGENQIKELIGSAKCVVFFIDEDQRVTMDDIGSIQTIRELAVSKGAEVEQYALLSQFRCRGSDGYLAWLDHTLGVRNTANPKLSSEEYEFQVFDSPEAMHHAVAERNGNNKSRVVAGYCWPWVSKKDPKKPDIVIGESYSRQWNLDEDGSLWIIGENSIDQVGCIHTCQGLELDYVGVIVGPDFFVRGGHVVCDPSGRARQDKTLKGFKKLFGQEPATAKARADLIIKNTYRTLMTRGMKGCFIYCTDLETRQYFRSRLSE